MKTYRRTLRKKRMVKYAEICAAVLLIALAAWALVIAYNPNAPVEKPKLKSSDYFAFSDLGALGESVNGTDDVVKLKVLYLTVTPIGGNATNVYLDPGAYTELDDYFYPEIMNGTAKSIEVRLGKSLMSTKEGTTFPVEIRIYCNEAEGYITLQIPETSVFGL
jgi:hypothetical protein